MMCAVFTTSLFACTLPVPLFTKVMLSAFPDKVMSPVPRFFSCKSPTDSFLRTMLPVPEFWIFMLEVTFCSMLKLMFPVPEFLMITVFWHMYDTSIFPVPLFCKIRSFVTSRQSHLKLPVPLQVAVKESSFTERAVTLPVPFMTTSFKCGVKMVMVTCALL